VRDRTGGSAAFAARLAISAAGVALVAWALSADAHWAERHVLGSYCATNPAEWVLARAARWLAGALGLGAIAASVFAPALARRIGSTWPRPRAGTLVGIALAIAASLGVTELYMRRLHGRLALGARAPLSAERATPMTRVDPRLGWSYFPGRTTRVHVGDREIAYAIDPYGDRAASAGDLPDPARPTVLFAGESIAFGYGLAYEETFPFLLGRDLGVQTANLAVVGFGNDQAYLRVLDALPRYRRPLAVVTLFVPDQIKRNGDVWRPRLALGPEGALTLVPPSTGLRFARLLQQLPYRGDEALRVTAAILRATAEAARARGAFPLFVVTNYGPPCKRDDGGEAWVVNELFVHQGLPFVRVDLGPEDRLPGLFEDHPNPRGARAIALAVERALWTELADR
jgi:DNA-binding transcriptional regulator YdaS (Cro superfamily)